MWPSEKTNLWYRSDKKRPDASSYIQHSDSSRLPKETDNRTIYPDKDPGWTVYRRQPVAESASQKSSSFSRLVKRSLRSCAHLTFFDSDSKIQGQQRTRRFMKIFFSCSRKHRRGTTKWNCLGKKIMYSASYKQEPISSSTQQHKMNLRENRKTTGVPPDNAGIRTDGIMEQ